MLRHCRRLIQGWDSRLLLSEGISVRLTHVYRDQSFTILNSASPSAPYMSLYTSTNAVVSTP